MTQDTPILRADLRNMTDSDYEQWLVGVRERQMSNRRRYEEVERAKSAARVDKLSPKLEAKLKRIRTKMDKIDADIDKVATLLNETSTLRKEIEVELRLAGTDHPELRLQQHRAGEGDPSTRDEANLDLANDRTEADE